MTQLRYSYTHLPVTSEIPKGDAPTRYGKLRKVLIDTLGTDFTSQDDLPDSDRLTRHRGVLRELRLVRRAPDGGDALVDLLKLAAPASLQLGATSFSLGAASLVGPAASLSVDRLAFAAGR